MSETNMIILLVLCLIFFIIMPVVILCWDDNRTETKYEYIENEV